MVWIVKSENTGVMRIARTSRHNLNRESDMKKFALTFGAAVVALTTIHAASAEAGVLRYPHYGWRAPVVVAPVVAPRAYYRGPVANCYMTKRKVITPSGWYWKRVRVCGPLAHY